MSQTTSEPDFQETLFDYKDALIARGQSRGPVYDATESAPVIWYDQLFEEGFTPSGTVDCSQALRVGQTNNGLDLILVANPHNTAKIAIAANATITVTFYESDSMDGTFTETGPSICVKAPAAGISVEPGLRVCRFACGNFQKSWLKPKIEFAGGISGGKMDAALSYMPR